MKINAKRILSLLLVAVLALSFAACSAKDEPTTTVTGVFNDFMVAEKIGTINRNSFTTNNGGLTYHENGLYGVISYEGLHDTGAIFAHCASLGNYFVVRTKNPTSSGDIATINTAYLIDGTGKKVIPDAFAGFQILNERYVLAAKATQYTYDKDSAIVTYDHEGAAKTIRILSTIGDNETWYEGVWYVYDIKTGSPVPNAYGTQFAAIYAKGNFIEIHQGGNTLKLDYKGEPAPGYSTMFSDGSYSVESRIGDVYKSDGTKLFSYDLTGYIPSYVYGEYYVAEKRVDTTTTYAIMNNKGEILSEGYTDYITDFVGDLFLCGDKVYNVNGENIIEGSYSRVKIDKIFGSNWMLYNDNTYTIIDENGTAFYSGKNNKNGVTVWESDFIASKKINDENYFYSHKDNDYTIKGSYFAPWIVKVDNANYTYDLVETRQGSTLLKGYSGYETIPYSSFAYYVYAKYNDGADVYLIVSGAQIAELTEKKSNLYDDLQAAFEAEGITVSINKETDEIAIDTTILFGGDSAVLTNEGKSILNKFIKAYSNVVYSEKYNGFINKTLVEGHAAPLTGSTYASGYSLSLERATNVMNYCLSAEAGIDATSPIANTLEAVGYSNSQPIYDADGNVNLEASRRVSFRFMVNIDI